MKISSIFPMLIWLGFITVLTGCVSPLAFEVKALDGPDNQGDFPLNFQWLRVIEGSRWIESDLYLPPLFHKQSLIVLSKEDLRSFSVSTGDLLWETYIGELSSELAVDSDTNFGWITTLAGDIKVVDLATGEIQFTREVGEVLSKPLITSSKVVVRTVNGELTAFRKQDARRLWTSTFTVPTLTIRGTSAPFTVAGAVGILSDACTLLLYREDDGLSVWEYQVSSPNGITDLERLVDGDADPLQIGNRMFTLCVNGDLASINLQSRSIDWSIPMSGVRTPLQVGNEHLLVIDSEAHIRLVSILNGAIVWEQTGLEGRSVQSAVVDEDHLYVGDFGGVVHAIKLSDGSFEGRRRFFCSKGGALDYRASNQVDVPDPSQCKPVKYVLKHQDSIFAIDSSGLFMAFKK